MTLACDQVGGQAGDTLGKTTAQDGWLVERLRPVPPGCRRTVALGCAGLSRGTRVTLPLLARCRMVSICSPDSFAFFMADVARGQPDKLGTRRQEMTLVMGLKAPGRPVMSQVVTGSPPEAVCGRQAVCKGEGSRPLHASVGSVTRVAPVQGYSVAGTRAAGALGREGDTSITSASGLLGFSWNNYSFKNFLITESVKLTKG